MAEPRWLGAAVDIVHVDTVTAANAWNTGDTGTLTINGKDLVLTVGTDTSVTQIALALKEMVNGEAQTGTGDHTFSQTGNKVGEFARITATLSGAVLTLTADDAGVPFTLTASESTSSDGLLVDFTVTAATGKNHVDNTDNWSTGSALADGDDIVVDRGNVDIKYGLSPAIQPLTFKRKAAYTGQIGLPKINRDTPNLPYNEYRGEYLTFDNDVGTATSVYTLEGGGGLTKIATGDGTAVTFNVTDVDQRADPDIPEILLLSTISTAILNVSRGDVGVAFFNGEAAHLATLNVSFIDNIEGDSKVVCGDGVDLTDANIVQQGGELQIESATGSGTIKVLGGELAILGATAHADIEIDGGTVFYQSTGILTTVKVGSDGTLDFRRDLNARTVTNAEIHKDGSIHDPQKSLTWSGGIDLVRCSPEECTLDIGTHQTLTPSAI